MAIRDYTKPNQKDVASKDIYKDIDITFERHPITNDITVKKDVDAVKRSLKNIILTNHYERPFKPNFGANLRTRLFDIADGEIGGRTYQLIQESIMKLEPRIRDMSMQFSESAIDRNELNCTIFFSIHNVSQQQDINFKVSRVR
tara:strand:- start:125 stop:556 length:432 start_codon:yes stop_codon:yes gene_type:complete